MDNYMQYAYFYEIPDGCDLLETCFYPCENYLEPTSLSQDDIF